MTTRVAVTEGSRGRDVLAGAAAMAPIVVAYAPFALVIGSTVATLDQPVAGWAGSWLIYGGSAHLAALQGLSRGSALLAVVTGLLINARLLVYSASLAPRWRDQPRWFRAAGAALLVDPTWALAEQHAERATSPGAQRRFYLAAGLTLGAGWSAMIAAGAIAGHRLAHAGLRLAVPLCLIALVGPRLRDRGHRWAAACGALVAVATSGWPSGTGIVAAIAAGAIAGTAAERAGP
jgi:predicted branched-subunit amino acid permease